MKKKLSLALALVMALSLSAPVFAVDSPAPAGTNDTKSTNQSMAVAGTTKAPTIKITVSSSGAMILNPYKLSVDLGDTITGSTEQIVSPTYGITNESNVALQVNVTVTGKQEGNATFAKESTQDPNARKPLTTNSAFVKFEMAKADTEPAASDTWGTAEDVTYKADAVVASIVLKKGAATLDKDAEAPVMASAGDDMSTPTYLAFHLTGDAVSAPETPWTDADKISADIAFTFTPTVVETPAST